jgi:hypothetical protein
MNGGNEVLRASRWVNIEDAEEHLLNLVSQSVGALLL